LCSNVVLNDRLGVLHNSRGHALESERANSDFLARLPVV
jgi:hypothetical protein